jgi:hypothetical protein
MLKTERPPRLPPVLLEALFPAPQLLTGRLAASTVAMYTRDCLAYVTFCGYDGVRAVQAETLRRWRTFLVEDTALSPHMHIPRMSATQSMGRLPRSPREACHPIHRIPATQSTGFLPRGPREGCHPLPAKPTTLGAQRRWAVSCYSAGTPLVKLPCRFRMDSPCKVILSALCTRRSRIASASVGSPQASCQCSTGNWLVTSVARQSWRSSTISSKSRRLSSLSGASPQSSSISKSVFASVVRSFP